MGYNLGYTQGFTDAQNSTGEIQYIYHEHVDDCYGPCTIISEVAGNTGYCWGMCSKCGAYGTKNPHSSNILTYSCGYKETVVWYAVCPDCNQGYHTNNSASHSCQIITCGKTTDTLESATIIF